MCVVWGFWWKLVRKEYQRACSVLMSDVCAAIWWWQIIWVSRAIKVLCSCVWVFLSVLLYLSVHIRRRSSFHIEHQRIMILCMEIKQTNQPHKWDGRKKLCLCLLNEQKEKRRWWECAVKEKANGANTFASKLRLRSLSSLHTLSTLTWTSVAWVRVIKQERMTAECNGPDSGTSYLFKGQHAYHF